MNTERLKKGSIFLFCTLLVIASACDKNTGPGSDIENNILITVLNQEEEDLLNPSHPNSLNLDQVKVYYELDGVKTEINRSNLDYPKMFSLLEPNADSENYRISLFMNTEDDSEITTTFLEWNLERTDVFKTLLDRSSGGIRNVRTWLNDELIWDKNVNPGICQLTINMD